MTYIYGALTNFKLIFLSSIKLNRDNQCLHACVQIKRIKLHWFDGYWYGCRQYDWIQTSQKREEKIEETEIDENRIKEKNLGKQDWSSIRTPNHRAPSYFLFIDLECSKKAKKGHNISLHLYVCMYVCTYVCMNFVKRVIRVKSDTPGHLGVHTRKL